MALSDTLVQLPGLREHPGTAGFLILALLVLTGVFFATRFRRLLAFFSGLGTGLILSQTLSVFMAEGALSGAAFRFGRIDVIDILVGLIGGILFLLFERIFAVLLTSVDMGYRGQVDLYSLPGYRFGGSASGICEVQTIAGCRRQGQDRFDDLDGFPAALAAAICGSWGLGS
jgi:hypothetical protein